MKRKHQLEDTNFLLRYTKKTSRDPDKQCFDDYDSENEFNSRRVILTYIETGEKEMQQSQSA